MDRIGAYCGFYWEQVRYAFRPVADGRAEDFLRNGWDEGAETTFNCRGTTLDFRLRLDRKGASIARSYRMEDRHADR